jgi:Tol biopolymer transport system component
MVTKSGMKILDFGLAKVTAEEGDPDGGTHAPTYQRSLTDEGTVIGTIQYMAPEQLEGRRVDHRSDIFALGAILYEMDKGKRAFEGTSRASVIAAIMSADPAPLSKMQPMTPAALDHVVRTCLEKDPEERWQSALDVARELRWIGQVSPAERAVPRRRLAFGAWLALAAAAGVAASGALLMLRPSPQKAAAPMRLSITLPAGATAQSFAVSPDGSRLAFVLREPNGLVRLWVRDLRSGEAKPLERTEDASYPFWSPDSRNTGYFAGGNLNRIDVNGGPPRILARARTGRGGAWNQQGTILFSPGGNDPLYAIPAEGGAARPVTQLDETRGESTHRWPLFLPDGDRFLYLRSTFGDGAQNRAHGVYVGSLSSKEQRLLLSTNSNVAHTAGHLLYQREGALFAQRFDPDAALLRGAPIAVIPELRYWPQTFWAHFSASADGLLLYKPGGSSAGSQLVWMDEEGNHLGKTGIAGMVANPRLSPDGTRVAVDVADRQSGNGDIWIHDLERGRSQRLTFGPAYDAMPVWSPDGRQIAFSTYRGPRQTVCIKAADGSGAEDCPFEPDIPRAPYEISPDGSWLLGRVSHLASGFDIYALPIKGSGAPVPVIASNAHETDARISPDGRWLAYVSDESGRPEVYVTRFPSASGKWQVSVAGGIDPEWRYDRRQLLFLGLDKRLMAVDVVLDRSFDGGAPKALFQTQVADTVSATDHFLYAVGRDGRILVNSDLRAQSGDSIEVFMNWMETKKR